MLDECGTGRRQLFSQLKLSEHRHVIQVRRQKLEILSTKLLMCAVGGKQNLATTNEIDCSLVTKIRVL